MERPLDHKETFIKHMHDVGTMANVCYVFFLSSAKSITAYSLMEAMQVLMKRHKLLRCAITEDHGKLTWKIIEGMNIDIRVDMRADWNEVFVEALSEKFDVENGPLWSLTLMPNAESETYDSGFQHQTALAIRIMHCIADGQSIIHLMDDLQDLLVDDETRAHQLAMPFEIPKPLQEFAYPQMGFLEKYWFRFEFWEWIKNYFIKPKLFSVLPKAVSKVTAFEKFVTDKTKCSSFENATTRIVHTSLECETLDRIHEMCHRNNVTIGSACAAAGNIAMCQLIADAAKEKGINRENLGEDGVIIGPVHRNHLPETSPDRHNYLADHSYALRFEMKISEWTDVDRFWDLAHKAQTFTQNNLQSSLKENLKMFKTLNTCISDAKQFARHFLPEERWFLLGYTNHGNCNFLNRGVETGIKVCGMWSGVGGHYYGGVIFHHIVTLDNKMYWNLNYATHVCDRATADKYLKRCVAILMKVCEDLRW